MDNQMRCMGFVSPEERAKQAERIKTMKAELTTTNFRLGDEIPLYESVNHEAMARAETFKNAQRVAMNKNVKEAVKKSSIYFGNEPVRYETVAHDAMKYKGNENDFSKLQREVNDMKITLSRHNFTLGDEKVDYVSDYHRGYGSLPAEAYVHDAKKRQEMQAVVLDSRAAHFSLGKGTFTIFISLFEFPNVFFVAYSVFFFHVTRQRPSSLSLEHTLCHENHRGSIRSGRVGADRPSERNESGLATHVHRYWR